MGSIKNEIKKVFENEYNNNQNIIKDFNSKINLFILCSKDNKNILKVIYTIGISIFISIMLNSVGIINPEYASITCLISSITLGSTLNIINSKKYKKKLKKYSLALTQKQIDEEMIRYCIERDKICNYNAIIKQISENIDNNIYDVINKTDYKTKDELLKIISYQNKKIEEREEKLDIISSKQTINKELGYNRLNRYTKLTIFSLIGIFSICYLPNIGLNSSEVMINCIKLSLITNIPINLLVIKNIIQDTKLYNKLNNEINNINKDYNLNLNSKIDIEYNKMINEIYISKIQLICDELKLSSIKEENKDYYNNNYQENIKEKNKVLIYKKNN